MADSQFTSTALGAIRLAQENAARLGHSYVGCEHLLLGLASQEYSPAACALRKAGADSHTLRCAIGQPGWDRSARPLPPSRTDAQLLSGDSGRGG